MSWTELPHPWALASVLSQAILEQLNRCQAQALSITYSHRATTQEAILKAALLTLATRYPAAQSVTLALLWGGSEGASVRPLVTFSPPAFRVLVRWGPREKEVVQTTACNKEEADAWLEALRKAKAHSVRMVPVTENPAFSEGSGWPTGPPGGLKDPRSAPSTFDLSPSSFPPKRSTKCPAESSPVTPSVPSPSA